MFVERTIKASEPKTYRRSRRHHGVPRIGRRISLQSTHTKLPAGRVNDWPQQGICSTPYIEDDRLYYVSNRAEVVCVDTEGFMDGENDGPFTEETDTSEIDGDIIWKYDMIEELEFFPTTSPPVLQSPPAICSSWKRAMVSTKGTFTFLPLLHQAL